MRKKMADNLFASYGGNFYLKRRAMDSGKLARCAGTDSEGKQVYYTE